MKTQTLTHGSAFILSLFIIIIAIVAYSYFENHDYLSGFYQLYNFIKANPFDSLLLIFAGFVLGYFQGKAFY